MEEEVERFTAYTDPLLACSMCRCLLREAVQLKCLHNCCRQCFSEAASKDDCRKGVGCGSCGAVTQVGSEKPNEFVDCQVKRYVMVSESKTCDKCKENGEHDKPALEWCHASQHWLCGDCISAHSQYYRQHVTQSFDEVNSLDEECSKPSVAACAIHYKPLDVACLSCEQVKCISCWSECMEKKHEMHIVGQEAFDAYVTELIASISTMERELLQKSAVLEKPRTALRDTKAARDRHLEDLKTRKRRVVDAVETAYQKMAEATKDAYDDLKSEHDAAAKAAERIASDLSDARDYIRRLVDSNENCEIFKQQKNLRERLNALSGELDNLSDRLATTKREVNLEASLPEDVEDVVHAWIGMPRLYSAFKLPVNCHDVALTKDGRSLLLAARGDGLIELSSSRGHELSRWLAPKITRCSGIISQDDHVLAVAALSDGRAAVSLCYTRRVVLLRRTKKGGSSTGGAAAAGDDSWTEDSRLEQLPWPAYWLSVNGNTMAVSENRIYKDENFQPAQRLQLLSLSSGRLLSTELQREYRIGSLAVTDQAVVTASWKRPVNLSDSRRWVDVLDAHKRFGNDERLWRHVVCSSSDYRKEEHLAGVCADTSGDCLYAAVQRNDGSSGCVSVLSLADGSELRRIAFSFSPAAAAATQPQPLLLPWRLSLSDDGAASAAAAEQQQQQSSGRRPLLLAALCYDETTGKCSTVTLHRSNMLQ